MEAVYRDFEFEIYVPLADNQGKSFPDEQLQNFRKILIHQFGGLTDLKYINEGTWTIHGVEFQDKLVIWRVFASDSDKDKIFFKSLKEQMRLELRQKEILIVKKSVDFI